MSRPADQALGLRSPNERFDSFPGYLPLVMDTADRSKVSVEGSIPSGGAWVKCHDGSTFC